MSPSAAIKTSSFWDKKIFFVSPGRLAKPKNLRLIGGGGGGGGGVVSTMAIFRLSRAGFTLTGSMGTDPTTKIFLPLPAYLIASLWLSRAKSSVGSSRGSTTGTIFPEAVRRMPGLAAAAVVCTVAGAAADDEG